MPEEAACTEVGLKCLKAAGKIEVTEGLKALLGGRYAKGVYIKAKELNRRVAQK